MDKLFVTNNIAINAPAAKVWDALINPVQTEKYMFGCRAVSDWKPGSSLQWKGLYEGNEVVFVKGHIVNIEPEKFLAYTTIDPNSTIADIAENYLTVTYNLTDEIGKTLLTVTQGDYALVADGAKRYNDAYNNGDGWNPILIQIKALVENGAIQN